MTDIDIPALKAAALKLSLPLSPSWMAGGIRHLNKNVDSDAFWDEPEGGDGFTPGRYEGETMATVLNAVPALIERLERAEAVAEYARSREMPTTEKQVEAAEMFFTAPMRARLEKLEAIEKLAQRVRQERDDYSHGDFADDVLAALEAP